ncbi:MAG: phytanoyl-CoA dioxygenase family protein [Planctomycetota bacterium]|nr:phytanoyl-CoA dioxygenase family protein [Planctomycetota bacterium]
MSVAAAVQKTTLTQAEWAQYERDGFLRLGKLLADDELAALQNRIDDIMLGKAQVNYDRMLMQLDSDDGNYGHAGPQTKGHKGATLGYRKIQELEFDPLFREFMERPIFRHICETVYGAATPIAPFRAMFMNKPAQRGTFLPWHQDRWNSLELDPLVTIWTALDPATKANGCVQLIPGSHKAGIVNPSHGSGFLTEEQTREHVKPERIVYLELEPGEVALLHNWTLHGSDVNRTQTSRRAFSACYMDARTRVRNKADGFSPAPEREILFKSL